MKLTTLTFFILLTIATPLIVIAQKDTRPNILLIISDDQGWGDVGFNGCKDIPTPNLDAIAKEGIIFEAGYASHPYCSPSRAGLLSGKYQQRFGHECNTPYNHDDPNAGLPLDQLLISELLQQNGYQTCAIGKWHLGDFEKFWPTNRGFKDWYGFYGGGANYWGNVNEKKPKSGLLKNGKIIPKNQITYLTDDFTNAAVDYIDDYSKKENPFFMYLAYNAPHAPIQATSKYLNKVSHIEDGKRAAYAAMVVGMDEGIGEVIEKLKETGEYDNTLIFFYSDNGPHTKGASAGPFRGHKGMLFEGGIRVPFIVSWPNEIKGGYLYHKSVSALDIYPTILEASHIKYPKKHKKLDGVSLLPFLNKENNNPPHEALFWRYSGGSGYAVQKGNYKLVYSHYKKKSFLFNLEKDPYEQNDLSVSMPNKLKELQIDYEKWSRQTIQPRWNDPHATNVSKEEAKRQKIIDNARAGEHK